jgi:hypothetical protein
MRVLRAEDGNAAFTHTRNIAHCCLNFLRIDMATGADDNVLRTASDVDVAAGNVGEIATVKPITFKQLAVLRGIV